MNKKYTHIIWDWNGTLLNDVNWCIKHVNIMLKKRNKKMLQGLNDYHAVFGFPIIDYYKKVGFDLNEESFELLAEEYIKLYHGEGSNSMQLHNDSEHVIKSFYEQNLTQIILSASSQSNLDMQLTPFHIEHYFDDVLGISNIYAKSKVEIGLEYINKNNVQNGIVIGDTIHDYEVSKALGVDCVLVAQGHQSKDKLKLCNVPVFDNLHDVLGYIL